MPRTHGRISAAIWSDGDFIAMRGSAQRLYLFLVSQPDLSHAGLMPMRVRKWAQKSEESTPKSIRDDLDYLADRDFIVVDEDTEEVLIRTLVRNDGVYKQPKVMLRMREDAKLIESPLLRSVFVVELDRLPLEELSTAATGRDGDGPSTRQAVEQVVDTLRIDFADSIAYPSEGVSDTPSDGSPIPTCVGAGAFPHPPTPIPHPPTPVPTTSDSGKPPSRALAIVATETNAGHLVAEWIEHCDQRPPGRVIGQVSKELKSLLDEGIDADRIRRALAEWNRKGLHPSTLPSVVHEIANRAPAAKGQQATNDLFDAAMERALERDRTAR